MKADYDFPEEYWREVSENAKDFIRRLLVVDPRQRLTGESALKHPWLSGSAPDHTLSNRVNDKSRGWVELRKQQSKNSQAKDIDIHV